jgi:hypothetical protein
VEIWSQTIQQHDLLSNLCDRFNVLNRTNDRHIIHVHENLKLASRMFSTNVLRHLNSNRVHQHPKEVRRERVTLPDPFVSLNHRRMAWAENHHC